MCFDHIVEEHVLGLTFNKSNPPCPPAPITQKHIQRQTLLFALGNFWCSGFSEATKMGLCCTQFPQ